MLRRHNLYSHSMRKAKKILPDTFRGIPRNEKKDPLRLKKNGNLESSAGLSS